MDTCSHIFHLWPVLRKQNTTENTLGLDSITKRLFKNATRACIPVFQGLLVKHQEAGVSFTSCGIQSKMLLLSAGFFLHNTEIPSLDNIVSHPGPVLLCVCPAHLRTVLRASCALSHSPSQSLGRGVISCSSQKRKPAFRGLQLCPYHIVAMLQTQDSNPGHSDLRLYALNYQIIF